MSLGLQGLTVHTPSLGQHAPRGGALGLVDQVFGPVEDLRGAGDELRDGLAMLRADVRCRREQQEQATEENTRPAHDMNLRHRAEQMPYHSRDMLIYRHRISTCVATSGRRPAR
jgi:hypothetical protein